jgi:hypothetical protein
MSTVIRSVRRGVPVALAVLALGAAEARPAQAACPAVPLAQKFLPWADVGWYEPVPDAGLEAGGTVWTFSAGARVIAGNESYFVGSNSDTRSLRVPRGGSATTASMCLDLGRPTIRFFVRNEGSPYAKLTVSAVIGDPRGEARTVPIGVITAGRGWAPSPPLAVVANALSLLPLAGTAFRFTPADNSADWVIDDVYVDPYGKG